MPKPAARFDAESVRDSWDRAAVTYARGQASGRDYYRYEFFGPAQLALCGDVHGMNVLDVGCGNGYFAREMAGRGARVTGIDISSRMIEYAKRQESMTPLGIEYYVLDAAALPAAFVLQSFDMATSCLALQDMPNVEKVFPGVRSLLRPGGRFVASIAHPCTDTPFRVWERDSSGRKRWLLHRSLFRARATPICLERLGTGVHDGSDPRTTGGLVSLDSGSRIPATFTAGAEANG
jgi:2-polyprenyl-3-methyl-5-hydroxy-6-metoxy-1,4-benzoquinol methylase